MINPQRLSIVPTPVLRSAIFATGFVGLLATGPEGLQNKELQNTDAAPRADISAPSSTSTQELAGTSQLISVSNDDPGRTHPGQTQVQTQLATAEPSLAGAAADASIANTSVVNTPEPAVETAPIHSPQAPPADQVPPVIQAPLAEQVPPADHVPPTEPAPVQVANANPSDLDVGGAEKTVKSIEVADDCLAVAICIDRYLWALYQRTPKEDSIKQTEWRNVTIERKIKVKGKTKSKTVTISKAFTKLVDQDFTWKDPKAAERARMPMMDYVIGGMDRGFKLKLFRMLRAADAAGLSPGITSAFRDDYRQSIASGLKAASNRSYHGGSLRGGYGHGVAADVVSVQGATRDARWASSDKLWKWVDAHGKEFGIARPYLGRDPPHVAPVDGQEYAKHNRGTKQAESNAKKVDAKKGKRVAMADVKKTKRVTRDVPRVANHKKTATASR